MTGTKHLDAKTTAYVKDKEAWTKDRDNLVILPVSLKGRKKE